MENGVRPIYQGQGTGQHDTFQRSPNLIFSPFTFVFLESDSSYVVINERFRVNSSYWFSWYLRTSLLSFTMLLISGWIFFPNSTTAAWSITGISDLIMHCSAQGAKLMRLYLIRRNRINCRLTDSRIKTFKETTVFRWPDLWCSTHLWTSLNSSVLEEDNIVSRVTVILL